MIARTTRLFAAGLMMLLVAACGQKSATDVTTTQAQAAVTTPAKSSRDWTKVVVATPEGGFRVGNPDAKVKFLEYASLTCPHCRDFYRESNLSLMRDYVAPGLVSYEYRNFVLNGPDLAVTLLARCQGAPLFFKLADSLYDTQEQWLKGFVGMKPEDNARIQALPKEQQPVALADLGKINDFFRLRGMSRANYEACLKSQTGLQRITNMMDNGVKKYNVSYTPFFIINDAPNSDVHDWKGVEGAIKTALR